MTTPLDPDGGFVEVGGVLLATPGVAGAAEAVPPVLGGTRGDAHVSDRLAAALEAADLRVQMDVELSELSTGPGVARGDRDGRGRGADPVEDAATMVAQVPYPGDGLGQVVLLVDEDGLLSWHPAASVDQSGDAGVRGDQAALTYRIPIRTPATAEGADRGPLGWLGKKVLKVLVFRLVDEALGRAGQYLAGRWEQQHRWYGLTVVGADGHLAGGVAVDWQHFVRGPSLLLVHGTFSRGATGFAGLPNAERRALVERYQGRVAVLDHPSISVDPLANARWFVEQFVAGTSPDREAHLVLDVVAHSRGGLVARALAERQSALGLDGRRIEVRTVVFVATPHAGTVLADPEHLTDLLDTYTNLLDLVPDVGAVDVLQVVLEVVKQLASGIASGLDGLLSMDPDGDYLRELNARPAEQPTYAAVAADFRAAAGSLRQRAMDLVADRLFRGPNDLVVPRDGAWEVDGQSLVPPGRRLSIAQNAAVSHSSYFASPEVQGRLREWLGGG